MKIPGTFFDKEGTLHIPKDVLWPGELTPKLEARAWLFWIVVRAKNYPGNSKKFLDGLGSRATLYRLRKHLFFRKLA